jgi:hypothetical protein
MLFEGARPSDVGNDVVEGRWIRGWGSGFEERKGRDEDIQGFRRNLCKPRRPRGPRGRVKPLMKMT